MEPLAKEQLQDGTESGRRTNSNENMRLNNPSLSCYWTNYQLVNKDFSGYYEQNSGNCRGLDALYVGTGADETKTKMDEKLDENEEHFKS